MLLSNAEKMKNADYEAINGRNIPSVLLMERAAGHIADAVMENASSCGTVFAFCGSGNNGGDGIAAASILKKRGYKTRVIMTSSKDKMSADSKIMAERYIADGGTIEEFSEDIIIANDDLVIDAIFGFGLSRNIEGIAKSAIKKINASAAKVISADIPSGVCADTGRIMGVGVDADITVTFSMAKIGHFVEPGCTLCGEIKVCSIGIPEDILDNAATDVFVLEREDVILPQRVPISHKGDYGKLLILGGSVGYTGAPGLCARASVKSGAGLVSLGVPEEIYQICAAKSAEEMVFPLKGKNGKFSEGAVGEVYKRLASSDVCIMGMGMGRSHDVTEFVRAVVSYSEIPMVIDADGLYALSRDMDILKNAKAPVVLTPHEGEFARMGGVMTGDRVSDVRSFAQKYDCILVLKGHRTMVALPNGEVYITRFGNPGMAKGGTGDVLAGIVGAMMGQLPLERAVATAVYIQSLAGDMACEDLGEYSMTASDIIEKLSCVTKSLL